EAEALFDEVRRGLRALSEVKTPERGQARLKALALVRGVDKSFGEPCRAKNRLKVGERGRLPVSFAPQVVLDRLVQGEAVRHLRRGQRRHLQPVLEAAEPG